ncbi:MAG: hypothetical protein LCH54_13805 [Bacteroidetes bacterium]|nr:hypothetical protein [Bacteroidota bacterium]
MKHLIFVLFLIPTFVYGQTNTDSIKFEIIKKSVGFLASDTKTFKNIKIKELKCTNGDYDCLIGFCDKNDLTGVKEKIKDWKAREVATEDDLEKLGSEILAELTDGQKSARKKLPAFIKYEKAISSLPELYREELTALELQSDPAGVDPVPTKSPAQDPPAESEPILFEDVYFSFIAIAIAFIALLLATLAYFFPKKSEKQEEEEESEFDSLKNQISQLSGRLSQKQNIDLRPLEEKIQSLENKLNNLESMNQRVESSVKQSEKVESPPEPSAPPIQSFFAKFPDKGNSFSLDVITNNQNGEQIFELTVQKDSGTFVVSKESDVQKFALSDYLHYLSDACDMSNQPSKNSKIITIEPGSLFRSGKDWIIQKKAFIEFK